MSHSTNSHPFVSVVIPVWNGADQIGGCLAALQAQTYPTSRFEVLVVDNASTDSTAEVVRRFPIATLLSEPEPGSYHARNRGLSRARGEYVAFTDADCVPARDWLERAVDGARQRPDAGVIAGKIELFRPDQEGGDIYEWYERLFSFRQDIGARKGFCATANWLSRREDLAAFGGFQADRKSGADGELARRFFASGRPIIFAENMVVHHPVRGTFADLAKKRRRLTGGRWQRTLGRARGMRILTFILLDTARRLKSAALDGRLTLAMRAKIISLVIALSCVAVDELIRLMTHRPAARA